MIEKIIFYLHHGTQLGWFIDPEDQYVMIFKPDQLPDIKSGEDSLPMLAILPTGELSAQEMFQWLVL